MSSSDIDLILSELFKADQKYDLGVHQQNDDIWMRCQFHGDGKETTPSCRLTINEGSPHFLKFKCHGCGEYGHWNKIAGKLGLQRVDSEFKAVGVRGLSFREKLNRMQTTSEQAAKRQAPVSYVRRSEFPWPKDRPWRNIPAKILLRDGAALGQTRHVLDEPRLIFPVTVWGEEVGYIYALIRDPLRDARGRKTEKAYINSKGKWKEKVVFGFDRARKMLKRYPHLPLWLVEGPRDRYWLEAAGCVVVANMGSSFSEEKAELIKILNPHRLLVGTDGDEAGNKLATSVHESLYGSVEMTKINWRENQDPCDQSLKKLARINRRFMLRK